MIEGFSGTRARLLYSVSKFIAVIFPKIRSHHDLSHHDPIWQTGTPGFVFSATCGRSERVFMKQALKLTALKLTALAVLACVAAGPGVAQEKIKVGVILTLSGPAAGLGQQARDGFALAIKDLGGKMAGRDVEVVVVDDELKPDAAVTKARGLLERNKVDSGVGPIFSNTLQATHKPIVDNKTFLISPNAGSSNFAGKECSP